MFSFIFTYFANSLNLKIPNVLLHQVQVQLIHCDGDCDGHLSLYVICLNLLSFLHRNLAQQDQQRMLLMAIDQQDQLQFHIYSLLLLQLALGSCCKSHRDLHMNMVIGTKKVQLGPSWTVNKQYQSHLDLSRNNPFCQIFLVIIKVSMFMMFLMKTKSIEKVQVPQNRIKKTQKEGYNR